MHTHPTTFFQDACLPVTIVAAKIYKYIYLCDFVEKDGSWSGKARICAESWKEASFKNTKQIWLFLLWHLREEKIGWRLWGGGTFVTLACAVLIHLMQHTQIT